MPCFHINIKQALFIIFSIIINNITITQMADNDIQGTLKDVGSIEEKIDSEDFTCPTNLACTDLYPPCIQCDFNPNCTYGESMQTNCSAKSVVDCEGPRNFKRDLICRYCYQTEVWEHTCQLKANCNSVDSPRAVYASNCTVSKDILCLGHRTFPKNVKCNWTGGYRWTTALALSITLGGFGADRFYLGHWQEGIGKLFSFGGLGVWTIIDVILISLHYLGPADGSLYI